MARHGCAFWFALWWWTYVWYADRRLTDQPALSRLTDRFMREWIVAHGQRDNRMVDVNVMRNLDAQLAVLCLDDDAHSGRAVALMGYAEKAAGVLAELPFAQVSERVWELKVLVLVLIFVYAFFKFSWSIRQFGFCSILVGATDKPPASADEYSLQIDRISKSCRMQTATSTTDSGHIILVSRRCRGSCIRS